MRNTTPATRPNSTRARTPTVARESYRIPLKQQNIDVIKNASIAFTYNFDDSIERFLAKARAPKEVRSRRGYTTVYDENSQLPTNSPVIYHPNGFLSHRKAEKPSTHLILSEDSFSAQLNDSITGRHAVIQSELSQKTCLIVGCSLQDPTLNFLLKKKRRASPRALPLLHSLVRRQRFESSIGSGYREAL